MPKRGAIALALTALALVLLLNFQDPSSITPGATANRGGGTAIAGAPAQAPAGTSGGSGSASTRGGAQATPRPATGSGGSGSQSGSPSGSSTVTGPTVNTRFGPVQVTVTLQGGHITAIQAVQLPSGDRRSASISSRAEPMLRSQALQAQSANIDGVSGATYTSIAYARSLQAALDSAGA